MPIIEKSRSGSGIFTHAGIAKEVAAGRLVAGHANGGLSLLIIRRLIIVDVGLFDLGL